MTLEQIRIFLQVAAHEHVTRAAAALNLTQSAVSAAVSALEARHGVRLFDRVGRGIQLTEAGRLFIDEARALQDRADQARRLLDDLGGKVSGPLRLGASQTVASYWLPPRLIRFHERFPQVRLSLAAGNSATVAQALREGRTDIGIVEGAAGLEDLAQEVVAGDRISVFVGRRHPWSDGRPVGGAELAGSSWVLREAGSGTRSEFERAIGAFGLDPRRLQIVVELPTNEACLAAVEDGLSATVLSRRAAAPRLGRDIFEAGVRLTERRFSALTDPRRHRTRAATAMLEVLRAG